MKKTGILIISGFIFLWTTNPFLNAEESKKADQKNQKSVYERIEELTGT